MDILDYVREFGGLGIAGYLIWWLTRKLNGKVDALTDAVSSLADATHEQRAALHDNTAASRSLSRKLDRTQIR